MRYLIDLSGKIVYSTDSAEQDLSTWDKVISGEHIETTTPDFTIAGNERYKPNVEIVSQRQLRLWLLRNKQKTDADIRAMLVGNDEGLIEWEFESEINKAHPLVQSLGSALGMSVEDIDQAFIGAKQI
jgi:hypothetical protein